jgi:hypothetical protein
MIDLAAGGEMVDDACPRANVARLAAAQALTGANSAVIFATGSIVGAAERPLWQIARQPRFIAAVLGGIIAYPMMNLVMTSAPLAMRLRPLVKRFQFRHSVAHRVDVCAKLHHRLADRAPRRRLSSLRLG